MNLVDHHDNFLQARLTILSLHKNAQSKTNAGQPVSIKNYREVGVHGGAGGTLSWGGGKIGAGG